MVLARSVCAISCSFGTNVLTVTVRIPQLYQLQPAVVSWPKFSGSKGWRGHRWSEVTPIGFGAYLRDVFMSSSFEGVGKDSAHLSCKKIQGVHSFVSWCVYYGDFSTNWCIFAVVQVSLTWGGRCSTASWPSERVSWNTRRPRCSSPTAAWVAPRGKFSEFTLVFIAMYFCQANLQSRLRGCPII